MQELAASVDELKERLERARRQMNEIAVVQASEHNLGDLFVAAHRYAEAAVSRAQNIARQTVEDARRDAASIVSAARREAESIIEDARRRMSVTPDAVQHVDNAIEGFTRVNALLIKGLTELRRVLEPVGEPSTGAGTPPPPPPAPPERVSDSNPPKMPVPKWWQLGSDVPPNGSPSDPAEYDSPRT
jgi:hypothetical protein